MSLSRPAQLYLRERGCCVPNGVGRGRGVTRVGEAAEEADIRAAPSLSCCPTFLPLVSLPSITSSHNFSPTLLFFSATMTTTLDHKDDPRLSDDSSSLDDDAKQLVR